MYRGAFCGKGAGGHTPAGRGARAPAVLYLVYVLPIVFMRSSNNIRHGDIAAAISVAWQLTPAEARSVAALAAGRSPREIAIEHDISVHTVRTQLKRAMCKAGVHTQSALVALVYTGS
jgi:DNA-binding CsgD family transcriptional regulator